MLSIVIPCYNESPNLNVLVAKCFDVVRQNPAVEIILVDNGSTDDSPAVMKKLLLKYQHQNLRTHRVPVNKGYGYGITEGLNCAKGDYLCWTHADLQTDLNDCLTAYELIRGEMSNSSVVKGRRRGRSLFDVLFTQLMSWYVLYKLKVAISDINAQPKLFQKSFWEKIKQHAPADFSLDLYVLIQACRENGISEFPVYFHRRVAGEAKGGGAGNIRLKYKLAKRTIAYINELSNEIAHLPHNFHSAV
ncbi:MAG TPA: glycosyltransferase family 2 protein [Chitinophagales bacterium]|nr:glycosyltransferase family 2 protein [Chitinophagales bacterium]